MKSTLSIIKNIKSNFILREKIFSMLLNSKKLDLVCYNKALQKSLCLNIENYKRESRKIIKGDRNGYGKIILVDENILLFEGQYSNGKKNGYGKEYYKNGKIKYKGEYSNGLRHSKGEEYYKNGKIKYKGEYSKGKLNGKGIEFFETGVKSFQGEYINERKWNGIGYNSKGKKVFEISNGRGNVLEYNSLGQLLFEGEYIDGDRNGKGKEYYENSSIKFEGIYLKGKKWNGIGYNLKGKEVYRIRDGKGDVKEYNEVGQLIFKGPYINGEKNGKGKEYCFEIEDDDKKVYKYEAEYLNGKKNGTGKIYINNRLFLEGKFANEK